MTTTDTQVLTIKAPNLRVLAVNIKGETPLVMHRFWKKAELMGKMGEGRTGVKSKAKLPPRDFEGEWEQGMHVSGEGWSGFPAAAIRNALISACRLCGFQMTKAKLSVFCLGDGVCAHDGIPLVRLEGTPEKHIAATRNATGVVDVRARPMYREWSATVRLRYDADQFKAEDVMNLLMRAGMQVGIGEGRPDSKSSNGMGWGLFTVEVA